MNAASEHRLEAVLFDLDDTLHDDTRTYRRAAEAVSAAVAASHGVAADLLVRGYVAEADRFWQTLSPAAFDKPLAGLRETMWAAALASTGLAPDPELAAYCGREYNRYRREFLELWPGALDLLVRLRARGLKLALITNGMSETHRDKIAILKLEDAFDEIFIADEIGLIKPDPRVFELAALRLGVAPHACAMVGDRLERDVRGASDIGMFTVWMNVRGETIPPGGPQPDAIVVALSEVEGVLPLPRGGQKELP
jgi:2-haloalkanoic acid dehalogenase type II